MYVHGSHDLPKCVGHMTLTSPSDSVNFSLSIRSYQSCFYRLWEGTVRLMQERVDEGSWRGVSVVKRVGHGLEGRPLGGLIATPSWRLGTTRSSGGYQRYTGS